MAAAEGERERDMLTPSTLFQLVAFQEGRCLDIGAGKKPHNPAGHDSWATNLVFRRLDGPDEGPVELGHRVKVVSADGRKCLDIGRNGGAYSGVGHHSWGTVFHARPLAGCIDGGCIYYGQPVGIFSGALPDTERLDIGCSSSDAGHSSWATELELTGSIWNGKDEPVYLNVYDVVAQDYSVISKFNNVFTKMGTGAYHLAVQLHGQEWSYGGTQDDRTGIYNCDARNGEPHKFRKAIYLGSTSLTREQVITILRGLAPVWRGPDYDFLKHNCCDFCVAFVHDLQSRGSPLAPIPDWSHNLAKTFG